MARILSLFLKHCSSTNRMNFGKKKPDFTSVQLQRFRGNRVFFTLNRFYTINKYLVGLPRQKPFT